MVELAFVMGIILGLIIAIMLRHLISGHGTLIIDNSNPEIDSYDFRVNNLDDMNKKKHFILKVKHVSQK